MSNAIAKPITTTDPGQTRALAVLPLLLVAWFFAAVALGTSGALAANQRPPIGLGLAILLPLAAFAIDGRFGHHVFDGLTRLQLPAVIAFQTFRVGGVFFIIAWQAGLLPAGFALPAGLGDIAVGLMAPLVAARVAAGKPGSRALARAWNVLGLLDLAVAVTSGVTHASSPLGVFRGAITTDAMARYPFSLIPTFLVPLAIILHIVALRRLAVARPPAA